MYENVFAELKAIQDIELNKGLDNYYMSRPEQYSEAVRKASHFIRYVRDKTLDGRVDTYFFEKSVKIYVLLLALYCGTVVLKFAVSKVSEFR